MLDATFGLCNTAAGKLYIAGFTGAFHCPDPVEFCRFETITGIKYKYISAICLLALLRHSQQIWCPPPLSPYTERRTG